MVETWCPNFDAESRTYDLGACSMIFLDRFTLTPACHFSQTVFDERPNVIILSVALFGPQYTNAVNTSSSLSVRLCMDYIRASVRSFAFEYDGGLTLLRAVGKCDGHLVDRFRVQGAGMVGCL